MWLHVTSCDYHVSWSLVHRKTHVNVKFVVPGLLWSSRMWGGFHQADRSVWCCHVGSPDDRKATAAVRSFCWLFFPVAFAEYISECNKSRHLEHSITLILVDIRVYLSCHWWLLVWSHVWRWRHIGPNMPQLWTGSLCEELSSPVSSFLCDSVAVWARGLVVNLCFAKVCVIARNSTTHLLTFSQSLKDFIGIDSFYRDLDPAFRHLPPSSTIFHHRKMRQQWSKWRQQLLRPWNNGIVRAVTSHSISRSLPSIYGHVNGENEWRKRRFRPMTSLGCPIRQTQLCEFARSSCQCRSDPLCTVYACTCITLHNISWNI